MEDSKKNSDQHSWPLGSGGGWGNWPLGGGMVVGLLAVVAILFGYSAITVLVRVIALAFG